MVRAVCARLDARPVAGVVELVPAYASVAVHYDPGAVPDGRGPGDDVSPYDRVAAALGSILHDLEHEPLPDPRQVEIPVSYGGADGPDLEEVARLHDMSPADVV